MGFIAAFVATAIAVHVYENGSASDRQAIATGACVIGALFGQPYACAAITTAHVYAETNDFKSALRAGITSAITTSLAIGASDAIGASSFSSFQSAAAHGIVGGALSHVQGGKFGHGFASSFITVGLKKPIFEKFSIASGGAYRFHRTATATTLGGLGAWASGGKPAFGAFVSALQHTYNYESHGQNQNSESDANTYVEPGVESVCPECYVIGGGVGIVRGAIVRGFRAVVGRFGFGTAKGGLDDLFRAGRTPKASELKAFANKQGYKSSQTTNGPLTFFDKNGVKRITIKRGSARTTGSSYPHVKIRNASGKRIDPAGNPIQRKSAQNHKPINYDL